jgi:predicted RNA binding protein YcfA (HicA-like mRNA interferase family)
MTRPVLCSGAIAVKKLQKIGWAFARQKGSHAMLTRNGYSYTLSVPQHGELGLGILRKLIKQAGITIEQFNEL